MRALSVFFVTLVAWAGCASFAHAETIQSFDVSANLAQDRTLTVTETITYDFGQAWRHGITRLIPVRYSRYLLNYDLHLTVEAVTMDGQAEPWSTSEQGDSLEVRIGDPSQQIEGVHTYAIRYRTPRAINDFTDGHELYWNVTGNEWLTTIQHARFTFTGPTTDRTACYTGYSGDTASECAFQDRTSDQGLTATTLLELPEFQGFTVVLHFPLAALPAETWSAKIWYGLSDNIWNLVPMLLALLMLCVWYVFGRDPRSGRPIIPQYEPPAGVPPALMAGLIDEDITPRAASAMILDIARRGFITIEFVGKDGKDPDQIVIHRVSPAPKNDTLSSPEQILLDAILRGEDQADLRRPASASSAEQYQHMRSVLIKDMVARGWFTKSPVIVRGVWLFIAGAIGFISFHGLNILYILLAIVVGIIGWNMPRITRAALETHDHILGLKLFLRVTEQARLAFTDAPARRPEQFSELLPAAVALGVEKEWAKQFEALTIPPPSYLQGNGLNTWTSLTYVSTLHQVSHTMGLNMAPPSHGGSGGSGFGGGSSGGGFGGGGGGSW